MYRFKRDKKITTTPEFWPQKRFNVKKCRTCSLEYTPQSPCHLYCSDECAADGKTSAYLKRNYGITFSDYKEMLSSQNYLCKICNKPGFKMAEHHNLLLVVDHCHSTGKVRGLLCHNCNRGIGLLQDSIDNLLAAIDYIEGSTTIPKGSTSKCSEVRSPGDG